MLHESYAEYVEVVLYILIALGVVSNPSMGTGYTDKLIEKWEERKENE